MPGYVKANWEIALDHLHQKMGVGIIIRNEHGEVLASKQIPKHGCPQPQIAETFGAFMAISFCLELGFNRIVFEGDAKNVVELIQRSDGLFGTCGHLIHDIQILLSN